ncbi:DUF3048 domain-containing protein [uncultured Ruthenibacterium sp.]|uniref:DUF3048 domain-containing protein n=1 Tax=uncultured Ruthenibacterium sp. TaxID=1905347 RepID=UPI00349E4DB0
MKRFLALFLAAVLTFSLAACNEGQEDSSSAVANGGISQPQTEAPDYNLLTGQDLPEGVQPGQRPVAIMVNNAQAAMPQRGIGSADAIFEMVTEGGITRMMAMYSDISAIPQVGPVRSARDQHLQFALPLNAIFVHIGSSVYAQNLLNEYQYQDIDGLYLGTTSFWFDSERAKGYLQEHCWYTDASLIAAGIEKQQINTSGAAVPLFCFAEQPVQLTELDAPDIAFSFSSTSQVRLVYDSATGTYLKQAYGAPQVDELTGAQLAFNNVIILFAEVSLKPDGQCTDFNLSSGTGYYCYGGKAESLTWTKGKADSVLKLYHADGTEFDVNSGKSYIAVVGSDQATTLTLNASVPPAAASVSQ